MRRKLFFILIIISFIFSHALSKEIQEKDLWRYDLEKAIIFALNEENLIKISNLATKLKGNDIQESIWNILKWEKENIKYDFDKAQLPQPIIRIWGRDKIEVIQGENNVFQTPYETIQLGKGICKDYALLTAGLLLKMDYSPVYILDIGFQEDPIRHVAAGIIIKGWLFILDQNPPPMDSGTYYKYWYYKEGKIINDIIIYEINKEDKINFAKYKVKTEDFKKLDYEITYQDLNNIDLSLMEAIKDNFANLNVNSQIAFLEQMSYLPKGYSKGKVVLFEFPDFLENYNPIFHFQFVKDLYENILEDKDIYYDLKTYKFFYLRTERVEKGIRIFLNLAS